MMEKLKRHLRRNAEVHMAFIIVGLFVWLITGCVQDTKADVPPVGRPIGEYHSGAGSSTMKVRMLEIEGVRCVVVDGYHHGAAMSCDWGR